MQGLPTQGETGLKIVFLGHCNSHSFYSVRQLGFFHQMKVIAVAGDAGVGDELLIKMKEEN